MSNEARDAFINRIKLKLSDYCAQAFLDKVLTAVSDSLFGFDIDVTENTTAYIGENFLDLFIDALTIQGRSDKTIERYKYVINNLLNSVNMQANQITVHHIRSYLASERERGLSDRTLEGYRQVVFFIFQLAF